MAKLMKKDVERYNEGCKNGFKFDIQYYLYHNEKTIVKDIKLDEEHFVRAHITFYNKYENYRQVGYYINVNISKWYHKKDDNFASSSGLGVNIKINDNIYQKKSFKEIQKASENLTDDYIIECSNINQKELSNSRIL